MSSNIAFNTAGDLAEQQSLLVSAAERSSPPQLTSLAMAVSDLIALVSLASLCVLGRHLLTPRYQMMSALEILPFLAIIFPALLLHDLYPAVLIHPAEEMRRIFAALTITVFIWASVTFLTQTGSIYSRLVFLSIWAMGTPMMMMGRYFTRRICSSQEWWGIPAVVLGSGQATQRVIRLFNNGKKGIRIRGVLSDGPIKGWREGLPPIIGPVSLGPSLAKSGFAKYAIIATPPNGNADLLNVIQKYCNGYQRVLLIPDIVGLCSLGIRTREIGGEIGFEFRQRMFSLSAGMSKRLLDILLCIIGISLLSPVLLLIAALVKLTSSGPIFFGHVRYGLNGKTFRAWKFRTMVPNADSILSDYLNAHPECLFEWQRDHKLKNDPRVTLVGKWLRRLSLDEFPQLLNVLMGQMSLVGPRPIVEAEIQKYGHGYELYARVRPGITGLWQVSGRNNTTYEERVSFDSYYVHNWSVWLDLYILLRTIKVLVTVEGAY